MIEGFRIIRLPSYLSATSPAGFSTWRMRWLLKLQRASPSASLDKILYEVHYFFRKYVVSMIEVKRIITLSENIVKSFNFC